jgi:type II secretory pathway pseudopilin PulG
VKRRGFSLLEASFGLSLLAIVLFVVMALIPRSSMIVRNTGYEQAGEQMAERMLEQVRGFSRADVDTSKLYDGRVPVPALSPGQPRQYPPAPYPTTTVTMQTNGETASVDYTFAVEASDVAAGPRPAPSAAMRRVTVWVYWKEPHGDKVVDRDWSVTSYLAP